MNPKIRWTGRALLAGANEAIAVAGAEEFLALVDEGDGVLGQRVRPDNRARDREGEPAVDVIHLVVIAVDRVQTGRLHIVVNGVLLSGDGLYSEPVVTVSGVVAQREDASRPCFSKKQIAAVVQGAVQQVHGRAGLGTLLIGRRLEVGDDLVAGLDFPFILSWGFCG